MQHLKEQLKEEFSNLYADDFFLFLQLDITNEETCEQAVTDCINKFRKLVVLIKNFKPIYHIAPKFFIHNFTRHAALYSKENIRCNAIVPHDILNDHKESFLVSFGRMSPLGRMCNREELGGPFTFLTSDASSYLIGSVVMVDGGWTT